ncbi:MAG: crossover junction endodeoxyribonuclease RuvC [Microcystaceae cyanobacterium]
MREIWLGIDPGLALIGWSVLTQTENDEPLLVDYGTIQTAKELSTPQRLVEIEKDFVSLVQEFQLDGIAVEMPFFNRQIKAAGGVIQALGIISLVSYREAQINPVFLHQSSWKCHLGNGRATKDEGEHPIFVKVEKYISELSSRIMSRLLTFLFRIKSDINQSSFERLDGFL